MRRNTMFLFNVLFCTFLCNAQYLKRDNMFYPHLDVIVANYYNCYFKFPNAVEDLIRFTECFLKIYPDVDNTTKSNVEINILSYKKRIVAGRERPECRWHIQQSIASHSHGISALFLFFY